MYTQINNYIRNIWPAHRNFLYLLLISLIVYLAGNHMITITDPVESNYVLTAKNMIDINEYLSPYILNHYWYDKPIFYYWELIASYKLFGFSNFTSRLPSVITSLLALIVAYTAVNRILSKKIALTTTIILASSFEFWLLSKTVITDMTLFLCIISTLLLFYIGYTSKTHKSNYYRLAYVCAAFAILTKGPIGFLLPGLIILIFLLLQRNLKELLHLQLPLGLIIICVLGGSWYMYMYITHGIAFIDTFFGVHNMLRVTQSEHPKQNVWYFYIIITIIATFPWGIVSVYQWIRTRPNISHLYIKIKSLFSKHDPLSTFLWVWALTTILVFQCVATKYTTYTFPALFPLTLLIARSLQWNLKTIARVAAVLGTLYIILSITIVPVLTTNASGFVISQYLNQHANPSSIVVNTNTYYNSVNIYSHFTNYKLSTQSNMPSNKADTISWDVLYFMPFKDVETLPRTKDVYLITKKPIESTDIIKDKESWHVCITTNNQFLYCRKARNN